MIRGFQEVSKEFKKHEEAVHLPTRGSKHSAGYDFYSPKRIVVPPFGKSGIISTDVKAYMQEGEVLILHVRSSIGIKRGLTLSNCTSVIDKDFYNNPENDGNICFVLQNNTDKKQVIEKGERVMQGIFMPFLIADDDEAAAERLGGIGSSGK